MRGIRVAAERRAHAAYLVRRDRRADATAADQNPNLSRAALHGFTNLLRIVRIIVGNRTVVSAEIGDLVAGVSQLIDHAFVERIPTMICANRNSHNNARACCSTLSILKPSSRSATSPGADPPNRSRQIIAPPAPTYRSHP